MKLSAPKHMTWWIGVIAGVTGVLEHYRVVHVPFVGHHAWLLIAGGWALLVLGTLLGGL